MRIRRRVGLFASGDLYVALTETLNALDVQSGMNRLRAGDRDLWNQPALAELFDLAVSPAVRRRSLAHPALSLRKAWFLTVASRHALRPCAGAYKHAEPGVAPMTTWAHQTPMSTVFSKASRHFGHLRCIGTEFTSARVRVLLLQRLRDLGAGLFRARAISPAVDRRSSNPDEHGDQASA